jgi:glycosyltransferase involved in cell wall biosynthesis
MQLVFAGNALENDIDFINKLETFKYRNDVHVYSLIAESETQKIISASYALVHPFAEDEIGASVLNAFKSNVPVIISTKSRLPEIAADAALYIGENIIDELSMQMILLYKDEKLRSQLIEKGKLQWQKFSQEKNITQLRNTILGAAKNNKNNSL